MTTATEATRIIAEQLDLSVADVKPESRLLDDLLSDDLGLIEITIAMEDAFEIDIQDDDVAGFSTVKDWIDYLEKRVGVGQ